MAIRLTCTGCGKVLGAKEENVGQKVKCPMCGAIMTVPGEVLDAEAVQPGPPPKPMDTYGVTPERETVAPLREDRDDRQPCPACGEMIKSAAVKCRFCGEIFDETLRRAERKKVTAEDTDLAPIDWVLCILCAGVGCIVGIVYMIQGKPKGGKMVGISLLFAFLWNVLSFVLLQGGGGR